MISVALEDFEAQLNNIEKISIFKNGLKKMLNNYTMLVQSYINGTLKDKINFIPHLYFTDDPKRKILEADANQYILVLQNIQPSYERGINIKDVSFDIGKHKEEIDCYDLSFNACTGSSSVSCLFRIADILHPLVQRNIMPFVSLLKFTYTLDEETIPLLDIQSRPLYYYTKADNAIDDFQNGHIYVSKIWEVNDPNEWIANLLDKKGKSIGFDESEKLARDQYRRAMGMVSLSKSWNIAPMWGQYADRFTGVVFEVDINPAIISEVTYSEKPDNLRPNIPRDEYASQFQRAYSRKSSDWSYEQECRWILPLSPVCCHLRYGNYFASMDVGSKHYKNKNPQIRLKSIICGPRMSPSQIEQLRFIKNENRLDTPIFKASFNDQSYQLDKKSYY